MKWYFLIHFHSFIKTRWFFMQFLKYLEIFVFNNSYNDFFVITFFEFIVNITKVSTSWLKLWLNEWVEFHNLLESFLLRKFTFKFLFLKIWEHLIFNLSKIFDTQIYKFYFYKVHSSNEYENVWHVWNRCYWKDVSVYIIKWLLLYCLSIKWLKAKWNTYLYHVFIYSERERYSLLPPIDIIQCILSQEFPTFQVMLNKSSEKKLIKTQREEKMCVGTLTVEW